MSCCKHEYLSFGVMGSVPYKAPTEEILRDALGLTEPPQKKTKLTKANGHGEASTGAFVLPKPDTFPAPVIVPGDLAFDEPSERRQTLQNCLNVRNEVTSKRRTIYVVPAPSISDEVPFLKNSTTPDLSKLREDSSTAKFVDPPPIEHVTDYLQAFYHGLPVKQLEAPPLSFTDWTDGSRPKRPTRKAKVQPTPSHVGLATSTNVTRIRCRLSKDRLFKAQLNLNDILDVATSILPRDAYALVMLINHDLYEDEDDDFCCGRAYGRSRISLVSTARYNPVLDEVQKVTREHSWPGSHCMTWVARQYTRKALAWQYMTPAKDLAKQTPTHQGSAVAAGVLAENELPLPSSSAELAALWLGRVCKTASHELGHCFGMGHCRYYACIMQGTANIAEDMRQPPYLCPVDLAKVLTAAGASEKGRYKALLDFCARWPKDRMFAAFHAWLEMRLGQPDVITL